MVSGCSGFESPRASVRPLCFQYLCSVPGTSTHMGRAVGSSPSSVGGRSVGQRRVSEHEGEQKLPSTPEMPICGASRPEPPTHLRVEIEQGRGGGREQAGATRCVYGWGGSRAASDILLVVLAVVQGRVVEVVALLRGRGGRRPRGGWRRRRGGRAGTLADEIDRRREIEQPDCPQARLDDAFSAMRRGTREAHEGGSQRLGLRVPR